MANDNDLQEGIDLKGYFIYGFPEPGFDIMIEVDKRESGFLCETQSESTFSRTHVSGKEYSFHNWRYRFDCYDNCFAKIDHFTTILNKYIYFCVK